MSRALAQPPTRNGELRRYRPGEAEPYLIFRYRVVRVWEQPLDRFLSGGLGTLPLAVLTDEAKGDLIEVVNRVNKRLDAVQNPALAERLRVCTILLLGLRYTKERIAEVRKEVEMVDLRESSFYQLIHEEGMTEGRLEEARRMILSQGRRKFGPPPPEVKATLEGITDQAMLESLGDQLLDVSSWEDLLAGE